MKVSVSFPLLNTFKPNAVIPLQSHTEVHGYQIWYTNSLDTKVHSNYKLATHIGFVIPIDGIKYALIPLIFPYFPSFLSTLCLQTSVQTFSMFLLVFQL